MSNQGIGASVLRKEDKRFISGRGHFTDDFSVPGMAWAAFVRSPHAHAKIVGIDTTAAASMPGVVKILTGADWAADKLGGIPCGFVPDADRQNAPPRPALVADKVRFVGDLVAMVIAATSDQAEDAAEKVIVDYEVLTANADPARASTAPLIHDEAPENLVKDWHLGDRDATDAALARAAHVVELDIINNRKAPNAIEPRASLGIFDPVREAYTLYTTSQNPHITRLLLAAFVMGIPETKVRIVSPDVGGGFGSKIPFYPEEALVAWAARKAAVPVKWAARRTESFLSDTHGRDHVTHVKLGLDADGKFLALKVDTIANLGAYLSTFGMLSATYLYATLLSGQYVIPSISCRVKGVLTNTCPIDAERGAGRPEAAFVVERIVETAARDLGIDGIELRRRNFIKPAQFPYQTPVALQYDIGDYEAILDEAIKAADVSGFAARKADSAKRGMMRGLGFSAYIEACGLAPSNVAGAIGAGIGLFESAEMRFDPTGSVSIYTGSHAQGQGHETTFAQIVSDKLGVALDKIEIIHGDTDRVQWGHGTYGSRSLAVGGSAIAVCCERAIEMGKKVAAHLMEASEGDIQFADGKFTVSGTDKAKTLAEVVMASFIPHNFPHSEMDPGLDQRSYYDPKNFTFPAGCHICELEVDPTTGSVDIVAWTAVDDFGNIVNPMIVDGQIHGGVVHGVGQALLEEAIYDEHGHMVTASYNDYAIPRADLMPDIKLGFTNTPCPHNPLGVKGCGEAGAIAAPAAVINALTDAIGVRSIDMPATPAKVWAVLREGAPAQAAE